MKHKHLICLTRTGYYQISLTHNMRKASLQHRGVASWADVDAGRSAKVERGRRC